MKALGLFSALVLLGSNLQAQTQLGEGNFDIALPETPAGQVSLVGDLFVPADADIKRLRLEFDSQIAGRNTLLFVRRGANFDFDNLGSLDELQDQADYFAIGRDEVNQLILQDFATPSVNNEDWFLALGVAEGTAGNGNLSISMETSPHPNIPIQVAFDNPLNDPDCDTAPWDDTTAFTPVGGNNATTLGEARRNAINRAASNLSSELFGSTPVRINACWRNLGGESNSATLAGANDITFTNFPLNFTGGRPESELVYSTPATVRLAGTELCSLANINCETPEIFIIFNTDIDSDVALAGVTWYYGFDGFESNNTVHFISTATHEIAHGLGFGTDTREDGSLIATSPTSGPVADIYLKNLGIVDGNTTTSLADLTQQERADAFISVTNLQHTGPEASVNSANVFATVNQGYVRMFAPATYDPGSSVSHLGSSFCDLMRFSQIQCPTSPHLSLGLAKPILHSLGWAPSPNRPNFLGLQFAANHNGHGFDFQAAGVDPTDGETLYVMTFYSYENLGFEPEWFQALGKIKDGVFSGTRSPTNGFGFQRFLYEEGRSPPQQADDNARGQVVLSFNDPTNTAACNDGIDRSGAESVAVLQWNLGNNVNEWCVQPLISSDILPASTENDFSGLWFVESDSGWGITVENFQNADGSTSIFVVAFVYAADGTPVWFFGLGQDFVAGQAITLDMTQRTGLSRQVENTNLPDDNDAFVGTMTLTLSDPSNQLSPDNLLTIDVEYQGPEGGSWFRDDVNIQRLTLPRLAQ